MENNFTKPKPTYVLDGGRAAAMGIAKENAKVTATDFHPSVPMFLTRNLNLNGLSESAIRYLELDWQDLSRNGGLGLGPERFESIIGSDILYEKQQPVIVASAIDRLLSDGGRALITDPGRSYIQSFVDEMEMRNFAHRLTVRQVQGSPDGTRERESEMQDVFVIEFERR
jgi:predicted nicotinamide N-methyase